MEWVFHLIPKLHKPESDTYMLETDPNTTMSIDGNIHPFSYYENSIQASSTDFLAPTLNCASLQHNWYHQAHLESTFTRTLPGKTYHHQDQ